MLAAAGWGEESKGRRSRIKSMLGMGNQLVAPTRTTNAWFDEAAVFVFVVGVVGWGGWGEVRQRQGRHSRIEACMGINFGSRAWVPATKTKMEAVGRVVMLELCLQGSLVYAGAAVVAQGSARSDGVRPGSKQKRAKHGHKKDPQSWCVAGCVLLLASLITASASACSQVCGSCEGVLCEVKKEGGERLGRGVRVRGQGARRTS